MSSENSINAHYYNPWSSQAVKAESHQLCSIEPRGVFSSNILLQKLQTHRKVESCTVNTYVPTTQILQLAFCYVLLHIYLLSTHQSVFFYFFKISITVYILQYSVSVSGAQHSGETITFFTEWSPNTSSTHLAPLMVIMILLPVLPMLSFTSP